MDQLPKDMLIQIFIILPVKDIIKCSSVCKRFYELSRDEMIWKPLFDQLLSTTKFHDIKFSNITFSVEQSFAKYKQLHIIRNKVSYEDILNCMIDDKPLQLSTLELNSDDKTSLCCII